MTEAFLHDRVMSLHHRAYEHIREGATYNQFCAYLLALAIRDTDPELKLETTTRKIWNTAQLAVDAGMAKRQAFPLSADL